jgi:hypothetical protein
MFDTSSLQTLLAEFEAEEPELGREFRSSPHLLMFGAGKSEVNSWEAWPINHLASQLHILAYNSFVEGFNVPAKLAAILSREERPQMNYYATYSRDTVERIRLKESQFEIYYTGQNASHHYLQVTAPALSEASRQAAAEWLAYHKKSPLPALVRGAALDPAALRAVGLIPHWEAVTVTATGKSQPMTELGIKFFFRALAVYPAYLLIWRGVSGESILRGYMEGLRVKRRKDFEAAAAELPASPADFWTAPGLPALPDPQNVQPDPGLGAHLPPTTFWPKPEQNAMFMDTLAKVYKNVPRKVAKSLSR